MNIHEIYAVALNTMRNTWRNISFTKFNKEFCINKAGVSN